MSSFLTDLTKLPQYHRRHCIFPRVDSIPLSSMLTFMQKNGESAPLNEEM